jgi:hypothetical protein
MCLGVATLLLVLGQAKSQPLLEKGKKKNSTINQRPTGRDRWTDCRVGQVNGLTESVGWTDRCRRKDEATDGGGMNGPVSGQRIEPTGGQMIRPEIGEVNGPKDSDSRSDAWRMTRVLK